jgi:hypothetical protein
MNGMDMKSMPRLKVFHPGTGNYFSARSCSISARLTCLRSSSRDRRRRCSRAPKLGSGATRVLLAARRKLECFRTRNSLRSGPTLELSFASHSLPSSSYSFSQFYAVVEPSVFTGKERTRPALRYGSVVSTGVPTAPPSWFSPKDA